MHEINTLLTVSAAIAVILFVVVSYFMRQAKAKKQDPSIALRNGLFAALAVFAIFIVLYEKGREKKDIEASQAKWCEQNPLDCRNGVPINSVR